jgi:hypothetical protein
MLLNNLVAKSFIFLIIVTFSLWFGVKVGGQTRTFCGTPTCNIFRDLNGNLCATLGCKGQYATTGNCTGKPASLLVCAVPPAICGPGSTLDPQKPLTCTTPVSGETVAMAGYGYFCASTNTFATVSKAGPECCVVCDPKDLIAGTSCRKSPFSQLTSGNGNCPSPIILDLANNGFDLTDAASGVKFDIAVTNNPVQVAWTKPQSDDAWLALDRNGNGLIDDGSELFGNFTPQPVSPDPNGFLALAVFDQFSNGGNNDGQIDRRDAVANQLLLWQDHNHNGISEAQELQLFNASNIESINLKYQTLPLQDQHGNAFRYRALVTAQSGARIGRFAYDVFLVSLP